MDGFVRVQPVSPPPDAASRFLRKPWLFSETPQRTKAMDGFVRVQLDRLNLPVLNVNRG